MSIDEKSGHGRQPNQQYKSLLIWHYLSRNTDENHFANANDLIEYLRENDITAERRSIYRDIDQLNKVLYMIENDCSIYDAEDDLEKYPDEKAIKIKPRKGYYLSHPYEHESIRLIFESVYSAKFIDAGQLSELIRILKSLASDYQVENFEHNVLNVDYVRTKNKETFFNVENINKAMSLKIDGKVHEPEQISFKYMRYSLDNMKQSVIRNKGQEYVVSPYQLLINEGNYYVNCYNSSKKIMQLFRVDRMRDIKMTGLQREGKSVAQKVDYKTYMQSHFGMYHGNSELLKLKFANNLLDAVIEKFGDEKAKYSQYDERHFTVLVKVAVSPQFFAWMSGFGVSAKIMEPQYVKVAYKKHLSSIINSMSRDDE